MFSLIKQTWLDVEDLLVEYRHLPCKLSLIKKPIWTKMPDGAICVDPYLTAVFVL